MLVLAINKALASEAFVTSGPRQIRKGSNEKVAQLINEMKAGSVHTLIMSGVNPVYTLADSASFVEGLKKVTTSVAFTLKEDETASVATIAAPVPHYLESWNDAEPKAGFYSLTQPTISTIFKTRQAQSSFLAWAGLASDFAAYLESNWEKNILKGGPVAWKNALHDGVFTNAGLELLQLLDQVFRMLLGQLWIDRGAGIAVSAVAGCARCCELGFASHKIGLDDLGRRSWCCWRGGMRRQSRRR